MMLLVSLFFVNSRALETLVALVWAIESAFVVIHAVKVEQSTARIGKKMSCI